jgi:hypothetical protein
MTVEGGFRVIKFNFSLKGELKETLELIMSFSLDP